MPHPLCGTGFTLTQAAGRGIGEFHAAALNFSRPFPGSVGRVRGGGPESIRSEMCFASACSASFLVRTEPDPRRGARAMIVSPLGNPRRGSQGPRPIREAADNLLPEGRRMASDLPLSCVGAGDGNRTRVAGTKVGSAFGAPQNLDAYELIHLPALRHPPDEPARPTENSRRGSGKFSILNWSRPRRGVGNAVISSARGKAPPAMSRLSRHLGPAECRCQPSLVCDNQRLWSHALSVVRAASRGRSTR